MSSREASLGKTLQVAVPSSSSENPAQSPLLWAPMLAIALAAFAVEIPFFFLGTPSGHDVEFHLYSWLDVIGQWKHGFVYPRWAAMAHFGYGEPRFVFYPPASWLLGATISTIFPWTMAARIYIWLALVAAGTSMFVLTRRWLARRDAVFAAVLYAVNPYHLVIVYWRSAFAELLAACLVPMLVLAVLKSADSERFEFVPVSLVLAAAWLTNAPAAVMIHYSLALLIVYFAITRRSGRLLLVGVAAVVLGACLASFYLIPAVYEQKWVNIAEAVSTGSRPQDNFLFIHTSDPDHDAFNKIISWIAALELVVVAGTFLIGRLWRQAQREVWYGMSLWAVVCGVLMFPFTAIAWKILPKLQFMQFPWRWLLCLSLIFALFTSVGLRRWWARTALCLLSLVIIGVAWHRVQAPWWDNKADLREMQDNIATGAGYEGTDEYTPVGGEPAAVDKDARSVTVDGPGRAAIHVLKWDAESRIFTAEMSATDQLLLRLFPYPAWKASVNGQPVETTARAATGQMLVPVHAGMNRVELTFVRTWDRALGGWISIFAAASVLVWMTLLRKQTG